VSKSEHLVVGLNLLRLLVQNRIAEFHTDLEVLDPQVPPFLSSSLHYPACFVPPHVKVVEACIVLPDSAHRE
jgi:hypothetical protein